MVLGIGFAARASAQNSLFTVRGVLATVVGPTASDADLDKAVGVDADLRDRLGTLGPGLFFLVRLRLRPITAPPAPPAQ
ncbi:hypothetical protein ACF068_17880 [Streptomyces sp. NPDC016309]|uniref:hypothetical protein n=1 Tax=Streptomyces sp. NPDC016309 TaxID=3364965 RepID=UPI0036F51BA8